MSAPHFSQLDAEDAALHDRWRTLLTLGASVGLLAVGVWAACSALRWAVHHWSRALFDGVQSWPNASALLLVLAMTAAAVVWGWLGRQRGWEVAQGDGIGLALESFHCSRQDGVDDPRRRYGRPDLGLAAKKAILTLLTLGSGAAGGLEGPVVLIGEALAAGWSRLWGARSGHALRTHQVAGIAAAVGTLLAAPLTAAFFATELVSGERIIHRKLAYALWASVLAYGLNTAIRGYHPLFTAPDHAPVYSLAEYGSAVLVALTVSMPIALGFAALVRRTRRVVATLPARSRAPAAALVQGMIAATLWRLLGIGPEHTLGMGEETIAAILFHAQGQVGPMNLWWGLLLALLARAVNTVLTIQSGGSAGMLVPTMVMGGVSGALTCELLQPLLGLQLDPALFAVVGIASALVAVVGVPLSAMAFVLEVFGKQYGPPTLLAVGVTYLITLRLRSPSPHAPTAAKAPTPEPPAADRGAPGAASDAPKEGP